MSIYLKIALCISLVCTTARANTDDELFKEGVRLRQQKQFLLSAIQFSNLRILGTTDAAKHRGAFGYALDMKDLNEAEEFHKTIETEIQSAPEPLRYRFKILKAVQFTGSSNDLDPKDQWKVSLWHERKNTTAFKSLLKNTTYTGIDSILIQQLQQACTQNYKSPGTAALLSAVIPGAGQLYAGSAQSAAVSFVINAVFGYATYELAKKHLYGTAVASGLVLSITYTGNIFNAARSAKRVNQKMQKPFEDQLYQNLFPELQIENQP